MLAEAIKYLRKHDLLEGDWTLRGDGATLDIDYRGFAFEATLQRYVSDDNTLRFTLSYCSEDGSDDRSFTSDFSFTKVELNTISEFVTQSIENLIGHATA